MPEDDPYPTLKEFWPYYLSEHLSPTNRALHVLGSLCGLMWLVLAVTSWNPYLVAVALLNGYAFAWVGHFFVEGNRPATFRYPLKSFVCDWILLGYTLTGRIAREIRALQGAGIEVAPSQEAPQAPAPAGAGGLREAPEASPRDLTGTAS